ncbi:MAG: hypothetical protein JNL02_20425 [Saprospiraceae bacterium]|nr:hypothetical protein [Saprospiraceae bacterium]
MNSSSRIHLLFYPSFEHASEFNIEMNDKTPRMKFTISKVNHNGMLEYSIVPFDSSAIPLSESGYREFKSAIDRIDWKHYKPAGERTVLDGVSGVINIIGHSSDTTTIYFHSPDRASFKTEYEIIDAFFNLAEKEVQALNHLEYLEALKCYFDYGLPIKKTGDNPLEYRFWGHLTSNEGKDLNDFLKNLPDNQPVIFDCTNFPGMGTMYYELFRKTNTEKDIYYLLKENSEQEDLTQIGNCRIFRSRNDLISAIKQQ